MADGSSSGPSTALRRRPSYRAAGDLPAAPAAGGSAVWFFCAPATQEESVEDEPSGEQYFLDACSLCKLPLGRDQDIYMYRGNVPFCSEDCRQEWMEADETREEEDRAYHRSISSVKPATAAVGSHEKEGKKAVAPDRTSRIFHVRAAEAVMAG